MIGTRSRHRARGREATGLVRLDPAQLDDVARHLAVSLHVLCAPTRGQDPVRLNRALTGQIVDLLDAASSHGEIWTTHAPSEGCVLWLRDPRALIPILAAAMSSDAISRRTREQLAAIRRQLEGRLPSGAVALALVAVDPERRRRGLGRELVEPGLERAGREGRPCLAWALDRNGARFLSALGLRHTQRSRASGIWAFRSPECRSKRTHERRPRPRGSASPS